MKINMDYNLNRAQLIEVLEHAAFLIAGLATAWHLSALICTIQTGCSMY